jgi:hypothetical protein
LELSGENKKITSRENYLRKSAADKINDYVKSFRRMQRAAESISTRLPVSRGISYEEPPFVASDKSFYEEIHFLLARQHIPVVLSSMDTFFIFISSEISDEELREYLAVIGQLPKTRFKHKRVFPLNALPLFYISHPMSAVSKEPLSTEAPYLAHLMRTKSVYAQGSLINTLARHSASVKHLGLLAADFLRIELALETGVFSLKSAQRLVGYTAEDKLYEVADRLRRDNFGAIQKGRLPALASKTVNPAG